MCYKLNARERNAIREAVSELDDAVEGVDLNYSGRFMYGATCLGFITSDPYRFLGTLCTILTINGNSDIAMYFYSNTCEDSMGLSKILYFPDIDWNSDEDTTDVQEFINNWSEE